MHTRTPGEAQAAVEKVLGYPVEHRYWLEVTTDEDGDGPSTYCQAALTGAPNAIADLADAYRKLVAQHMRLLRPLSEERQMLRSPRGTNINRRQGTLASQLREEVLSEMLARSASKSGEVTQFRGEILPHGLLRPRKVEAWIRDQARMDATPTMWTEVPLPPDYVVAVAKGRGGTIKSATVGVIGHRQLYYVKSNRRSVEFVFTAADGVLERLRCVSRRLARLYGWGEAAATMFVLTGETPFAPCIKTCWSPNERIPLRSRLTLEIDPTLPPSVVAAHYKRVRSEILGARRLRSLGAKHLRLAQFVALHAPTSWSDLMDRWNRTVRAAGDKYHDRRYFKRDAGKATERLMRSPYSRERARTRRAHRG